MKIYLIMSLYVISLTTSWASAEHEDIIRKQIRIVDHKADYCPGDKKRSKAVKNTLAVGGGVVGGLLCSAFAPVCFGIFGGLATLDSKSKRTRQLKKVRKESLRVCRETFPGKTRADLEFVVCFHLATYANEDIIKHSPTQVPTNNYYDDQDTIELVSSADFPLQKDDLFTFWKVGEEKIKRVTSFIHLQHKLRHRDLKVCLSDEQTMDEIIETQDFNLRDGVHLIMRNIAEYQDR